MEEPGNPLPSERPSGTPPRVPPVTASGKRSAGGGSSAGPALRMPRPPSLLPYIFWLCLRPETWAESARFKTRHIVRTLLFVIFATALLVGISQSAAAMRQLQKLALAYDAHYAPLNFKDGRLSVADDKKPLPRFEFHGVVYAVDPTGNTSVPENGMLINDRLLIMRNGLFGTDYRQPLSEFFDAGKVTPLIFPLPSTDRIDSAYLLSVFADNVLRYGLLLSLVIGFAWTLMNSAWAFLVAYLAIPFIQLAAPNLGIPRRVAYKMTLAITVPLIVLDAVLRSFGLMLSDTVGAEAANVIWLLAVIGMAIYTGMLANEIYARRPQKPRRST